MPIRKTQVGAYEDILTQARREAALQTQGCTRVTTVETQFMSREEKANRSGMHQIEPILSKSRMFEMGLMNTGSRQRVLARVSGGVGFGQMVGRRQVARLAPEHPQLVSHPDPLLCI